jgi:hypothetical protein
VHQLLNPDYFLNEMNDLSECGHEFNFRTSFPVSSWLNNELDRTCHTLNIREEKIRYLDYHCLHFVE